jgi:hypothetical protein
MDSNEVTTQEEEEKEEKEPIYFAPKRLNLVSDFASILSWIVLVGFIADVVLQIVSLQMQMKSSNLLFSTLAKDPSFFGYLFINIVRPLLTGLTFFAVLQGIAVGLNVLLELNFNVHESKEA